MVYSASSCTGAAANAPAKSPTVLFGAPAFLGDLGLGTRACQIVFAHVAAVVHLDQLTGRACLLKCLRYHHRNCLVVVLNLRTTQQLGRIELALLQLAGVLRSDDAEHAGRIARSTQINTANRALGNAGADHVAIGRLAGQVMMLVRVRRHAGGLERAVDAVDRLADDLALVDGIGTGGSVEFHVRPSCPPGWRSRCVPPAAP